jgi:hypothetical protein
MLLSYLSELACLPCLPVDMLKIYNSIYIITTKDIDQSSKTSFYSRSKFKYHMPEQEIQFSSMGPSNI